MFSCSQDRMCVRLVRKKGAGHVYVTSLHARAACHLHGAFHREQNKSRKQKTMIQDERQAAGRGEWRSPPPYIPAVLNSVYCFLLSNNNGFYPLRSPLEQPSNLQTLSLSPGIYVSLGTFHSISILLRFF